MTIQHANEPSQPRAVPRLSRVYPRPHLVARTDQSNSRVFEPALELDGVAIALSEGEARTAPPFSFVEDPSRYWSAYAALKRFLDLCGALVLGVVFSPLILAIVLLMRRDGGSVIYRHLRVGRDGRLFQCLKFRTMVADADKVLYELLEQRPELKAEWIKDHKLRNDPRVTTLGRFLRRTSLDELPQIWNVIRGEMSLVGPRPVVRDELFRYGRNTFIYTSTKPGITGLWQVNGRNNTDYRRRVAMDVYYVRRKSLVLDFYILLRTVVVVLQGNGAY